MSVTIEPSVLDDWYVVASRASLDLGAFGAGTAAYVELPALTLGGGEVKIVPEGADGPVELPGEVVDIDASFVAAVRSGGGSSILCDYEEGLKSAAVSIAANESASNGNPVRCWT